MRKLRVFRSVGEVFSGVTRHYFQLLVAAWPALVFVAIGVGLYVWFFYRAGIGDVFAKMGDGSPTTEIMQAYMLASSSLEPGYYAAMLLIFIATAVAAVRWHRFVLLGDGSASLLRTEDGRYIWTFIKVMFAYFLFLAALMLVFMGIAAVFAAVASVGTEGSGSLAATFMIVAAPLGFLAYLLILALLIRLMLALPDAAIGQPGRVVALFKATHGNTWRILGYMLLIGLIWIPLFVLAAFIIGAVAMLMGTAGGILAGVLYLAVYLYFLMTQITMLSVAYREIIGLPGEVPAEGAPEPLPAA